MRLLPATESLGTSTPSVTGMVRRMQKQGLVDLDPDKRTQFTERGFKIGEDMARRHRLAEWFVVRLIGMDLQPVHPNPRGDFQHHLDVAPLRFGW